MKDMTFLYGNNENNQYTGRMEVRLKEAVDGEILRHAVAVAEQRYPYFKIKVVRDENGELDIVPNDAPLPVTEGEEGVCLGTKEANYHYIAVAYCGKNAYFDAYHPLTDATGLIPFVKSVMYYYFSEMYQVSLDPAGINLSESEIPAGEICEGVPQFPTDGIEPIYEYKGVPPFSLFTDGGMEPSKSTVCRIKIKEADLVKYAKSKDGSPNVVISVFLCKAIAKDHPDAELPIVGGMAVNLRPAYGLAPDNYHNLATVVHLKYDKKVWDWEIPKLLTCSRGMIFLQTQPENFIKAAGSKDRLYHYIVQQGSDEERYKAMQQLMESHNLDTFDISYVGRVFWGAVEKYIDGFYMMTYPSKGKGISVKMNAINGYFNVTFVQKFKGGDYLKNFLDLLKAEGIEYLMEEPELMVPVKVNTYFK